MADIAMLVAEEYERRVKNSRKSGNGEEEVELFSGVSLLLAKKFEGWTKENYSIRKEMVKWVPKPRSQIGVEAINGLFSA